ncbi:MAG: DUF4012 domain-containing protein [Candidatus Beckwithbacteria bacterium]|nr:DUF4012 domain-containing protein [Candidatus Beckwithbacteria bacterium]
MVKIKDFFSKHKQNLKLIVLIIGGFYLSIIVYLCIFSWFLSRPTLGLVNSLKAVNVSIQNKNLGEAETNLNQAQQNFQNLEKKFGFISWVRFVPLIGGYISDADHGIKATRAGLEAAVIVVQSIKPYADVLGFSGTEASLNIQSAEEKIVFMLQTLDKISPQLETIGQKVGVIEAEISHVNPRRYPKVYAAKISQIQTSLVSAKDTLANIKPLLTLFPKLLGESEPQQYLLIFQNNAELRATGGFLTAYAILETFKGQITPKLSSDIYELDTAFGNRLPAPEPIKKYLPLVYNWHLRDMNLSPDFKVSMDTFFPNYQSVAAIKDVNGVIAVDTQVMVDLLQVLGKVGVADWGEYSADIVPQCNCPQVVYKMEDYATRPTYYIKANRKGMIGPLMHSILLNVMNSPKKLWPQFVEIALKDIQEKHLMFYFPGDDPLQPVVEAFNAAGRIKDYQGDYFHLNDTNFAGAKSNLYVDQTVTQEINISPDGTITKTVTIDYKNPQAASDCNLETGGLCLNGILRDWVRLYVPEGTELVEVLGSSIEPTTSKDLGKTVLEAFIELRPQSSAKLIFKYKLPFKKTTDYKLLIQKQPGTKNFSYTISSGGKTQTFSLDGDKEISL